MYQPPNHDRTIPAQHTSGNLPGLTTLQKQFFNLAVDAGVQLADVMSTTEATCNPGSFQQMAGEAFTTSLGVRLNYSMQRERS